MLFCQERTIHTEMAVVFCTPRRRAFLLLFLRQLSSSSFAAPDPVTNSPPFPTAVDPATVRRLARERRFSDISALVEPLKSDPRASQEPFAASLVIAYASAGMLDAALATLADFPRLGSPRSALSLNALLSALNRLPPLYHRVPQLFSSLTESHSIAPDTVSYGILIKSHCLSGDAAKALAVLAEMENKGLKPTTIIYTTIIDLYCKEKKADEAEKVWNEMLSKGLVPDLPAYNVRLKQRAFVGTPASVLELLDEMCAAGVKPDTISFNYLIICYCRNKQFEEAKKVYKSLEEKGCEPNVATYNKFLHALCKSGDFDGGLEVWMDGIKRGKLPDFGLTKLLVEGLVKGSRVRMAKRVVSKVRNKFPENFRGEWKKLEKQLGLNAHGEEEDEQLLVA